MGSLKTRHPIFLLYLRCICVPALAWMAHFSTTMAQQIIVNSNGDRIVMYPDGSWRPVAPQDSILLRQYLQKSGAPAIEGNSPGNERTESEEQDYLAHQLQELKLRVLNQEKKVQSRFRDATNAQFRAAEQWRNAEENKALFEPAMLQALSAAYEFSIRDLRNAKLNQKAIKKVVSDLQVTSSDPTQITQHKLNKLQSKFNIYLAEFDPSFAPAKPGKTTRDKSAPPTPIPSASEKNPPQGRPVPVTPNPVNLPSEETNRSASAPSRINTKAYTRAPINCTPSLDTIDEVTGRNHIVLSPAVIFTHTDPDLRPFLKDKDLITCTGKLWKVGPYVYLDVDFQIASSHSIGNFGSLQNGSLLRLKLLDGDFVSLYNLKTDRGHIDPYSGNTIFSGQFALGKDEIKKLRASELDKMRVLWATGYEDYDVYNLDFFIQQLDCLFRK